MSEPIKQIKSTGNVPYNKLNLYMTEFANPDSRKLVEFHVAWVEKWENLKLPTLIFCSFFFAICRELV